MERAKPERSVYKPKIDQKTSRLIDQKFATIEAQFATNKGTRKIEEKESGKEKMTPEMQESLKKWEQGQGQLEFQGLQKSKVEIDFGVDLSSKIQRQAELDRLNKLEKEKAEDVRRKLVAFENAPNVSDRSKEQIQKLQTINDVEILRQKISALASHFKSSKLPPESLPFKEMVLDLATSVEDLKSFQDQLADLNQGIKISDRASRLLQQVELEETYVDLETKVKEKNEKKKAYDEAKLEYQNELKAINESKQAVYMNVDLLKGLKSLKEAETKAESAYQQAAKELKDAEELRPEEEQRKAKRAVSEFSQQVDEYRQAVVSLIKASPEKKQNAKKAVSAAMIEVEKALQNVSKHVSTPAEIEKRIKTLEEEPQDAQGKSTLLSLRKLQSTLEEYGITGQNPESERIQQRAESLRAAIAEDGPASKLFHQMHEKAKNLETSALSVQETTAQALDAMETLDKCIVKLRTIDAMLAVEEGLNEFKAKNQNYVQELQAWRNSNDWDKWGIRIITFFVVEMVKITLQWYYESQGEEAEAIRVSSNKMFNYVLGLTGEDAIDFIGVNGRDS